MQDIFYCYFYSLNGCFTYIILTASLSPCPSSPQCMQGVISGIMRATGRQAIVAVVNFFCYYTLGLPLGITLALKLDLKAKGIWIGLGVADFVQVRE